MFPVMKSIFYLMFISLLTTQLCSGFSKPQIPLSGDIRIRDATTHDINDITTVVVDAFSPGPDMDYLYQFRKQHLKYHTYCIRKEVRSILKSAILESDAIIKVIETPFKADVELEENLTVVAVALWKTTPPFYRHHWKKAVLSQAYEWKTYNCSAHLDANLTRTKDFDQQLSAATEHCIGNNDQVYLGLLATHPDFDGHGYGAAHLHWGMSLAKEKGLNVTLIATPAGHPLYKSVGFDEVKNITINRLDGEEALWFEFMRWMP